MKINYRNSLHCNCRGKKSLKELLVELPKELPKEFLEIGKLFFKEIARSIREILKRTTTRITLGISKGGRIFIAENIPKEFSKEILKKCSLDKKLSKLSISSQKNLKRFYWNCQKKITQELP